MYVINTRYIPIAQSTDNIFSMHQILQVGSVYSDESLFERNIHSLNKVINFIVWALYCLDDQVSHIVVLLGFQICVTKKSPPVTTARFETKIASPYQKVTEVPYFFSTLYFMTTFCGLFSVWYWCHCFFLLGGMKMSGSAGLFNKKKFFFYLVGSPKVGRSGRWETQKKIRPP